VINYNMHKIIRVDPEPKHFSLGWMLGSRCNYECMYCPADLHDTTSKPHDLATMQQVWTNVYEKTKHKKLPYKISFTGGEVTANKNFLPLIQWLRQEFPEIAMIMLTTNGSASLNYYRKLAAQVEAISFSTHSEYMNETEFFKKVLAVNRIMVRPRKSFHVNIMDEYWNQDRIKLYEEFFNQHKISYSTNKINYKLGTRDFYVTKGKQDFEFN
jgi:molybdenum cofactor biosynthesis enzyme MoaA